jgi:DNA ligase-1
VSEHKSLPTLYKLDSKGKLREWVIETCTIEGITPYYTITHGLQDGKQQIKTQLVPKGKNIGRANETTPDEQCILEAQSKWNKQRDRKRYSETIPTERVFGPMLAQSFAEPGPDITILKDGKKIVFPCYCQPKLDCVRCLASWKNGKVVLKSREETVWKTLVHLEEELVNVLANNQDIVLDGELYVHHDEFQDLISAIKRDEPNEESAKIQYHIYDYYNGQCPERTFLERESLLPILLSETSDIIKLVETSKIRSIQYVEEALKSYLDDGYEGMMLRNKKGAYKVDGRSKDLQKVKLFIDMEFSIVGAAENDKKPDTCKFFCVTKEGYEFKVMMEGSDEQRKQYWTDWKNKVIQSGDELTCRFFCWTTSEESVPRFPVGLAIRDYE